MEPFIIQNTTEHHDIIINHKFEIIDLMCPICLCVFKISRIKLLKNFFNKPTIHKYCSRNCSNLKQSKGLKVKCNQCNKMFIKKQKEIKKSTKNFCSLSCNATYQNQHKNIGFRRSKIEIYLEEIFKTRYPHLSILCNDRSLGYELDFYFPDLKFAIELNGPVHYEPIYGNDKFNKIQNIDQQKNILCYQKGIELCVVDISKVTYWKPLKYKEYEDKLCIIIDSILGRINN